MPAVRQREDPHEHIVKIREPLEVGPYLGPKQRKFVDTVNAVVRMLDNHNIGRESWMVIAGGAVFLYQLDLASKGYNVPTDRVPTDLDVVVNNDESRRRHILEVLRDRIMPLEEAELTTAPVLHFGHLLKGPTLKTVFNGVPVDLITELSQEYSPDHRFAPAKEYRYPPADRLFASAIPMEHPLLEHDVMLAHPGFIAFYKTMLARDRDGKQDTDDIRRLKAMCLLDPSEELTGVMRTMCHGDEELIGQISKAIAEVGSVT